MPYSGMRWHQDYKVSIFKTGTLGQTYEYAELNIMEKHWKKVRMQRI